MATRKELELLNHLKAVFDKRIPSGNAIARAAIAKALPQGVRPSQVKVNFSKLVESVQEDAYRLYLKEEKKAWTYAFPRAFGPALQPCSTLQQTTSVLSQHFYALDKFFLSRTQSRRNRAGGAFEILIDELFACLKYPATYKPRIDGNPDFVLPSVAHYDENPLDVIVFTVKRSLRERWRQITTEGTRGLGLFLATIDEEVSQPSLAKMQDLHIFLVVPTRIKVSIPRYQAALNVLSFEDFFINHLDPAMKRWRRNKVIR